jgi:tetratricopeptide (TPR) repeat protein
MDEKDQAIGGTGGHSFDANAVSSSVPLIGRLSHEIPKPKDWQALQRGCVLLFRAELQDPHAQEYGRGGQDQGGIDILGRRYRDPSHFVGIQCRKISKPLKQPKILADCRAALELEAGLKEIIFATTADDDTHATDAAIAVERLLRSEGHDLSVAIYGWGSLQTLIAAHEIAYHAFFPAAVASSARQSSVGLQSEGVEDLAARIASHLGEQFKQTGFPVPPREAAVAGTAAEDPALHVRIDTFRDLFKDHAQPTIAKNGLLSLLEKESLDGKPWARFRIETNLGSIALDLGQENEAATRFEAAYNARPKDPNSIANLALARTIQQRYAEAMELAREALNAQPRADHAVAYLLQAAARSDWSGDPETLIPPDLMGTSHADMGLAEFLRWRNVPGWPERSVGFARAHPEVAEFKRVAAIAVLALALDSGTIVCGGLVPVSLEEIGNAADAMRELAERCINIGFADHRDLNCYLNNAAVLLRLAGRHAECEALLQRGLQIVPATPQLRRVLALSQAAQGRAADALATLAVDEDVENRLLSVELMSRDDGAGALELILGVQPALADRQLYRLRWRILGDLAIKVGDKTRLNEAIAGLRSLEPNDVTAFLLQIRRDRKAGVDEETIQNRLRQSGRDLPKDTDLFDRYLLAEEMRDQGLPEEASALVEPYVDIRRPGPMTKLYLQTLAESRRDDAFYKAVASAGPKVRDDPEILWTCACHAWNTGDLVAALRSVEKLLETNPQNPQARLLKIEILLRQNRSVDLLAELDKPVEKLPIRTLRDRFRVASLLGHFGYMERAATFAYRLFLENRDKSQAWMTLSTLVLREGRADEEVSSEWNSPVVALDTAVDLAYDDGEKAFIVIEPNADLRRLDNESWEPDHPLVRAVIGLSNGDRFTDPAGRTGTVAQIRHKLVARLHYVLENHQTRFPEIQGFRKISVDVEQPGGLDEMIAELKARHDWIQEEQERYRNSVLPLAALAHRVGHDVIETAGGLASQGLMLKVAAGNEQERLAAVAAIRANAENGCILDLLAFWTSWRLQALDAIVNTCGTIHVAQSVIDHLRARRELINDSVRDGRRSAAYRDGKIALSEVAPEVVRESLRDLDQAIGWIETNAKVCPLLIEETLPAALRENLRRGDVFDSLALAMQTGRLLITDDLPTREIGRFFGFEKSAWLHQVFSVGLNRRCIASDTFIRWSADLIAAGHSYIGVSGSVLARSAHLDAQAGNAPGYLFNSISKVIGGRAAEPRSHIVAVVQCLRSVWTDPATHAFRQPITGLLLRQFIREREADYAAMLRAVMHYVRDLPHLVAYLRGWVRGHFLPATTLRSEATAV